MRYVTIVMSTFAPNAEREGYALRTLDSMIDNFRLEHPDFKLRLHVADDGSPSIGFIQELVRRAERAWYTPTSYTIAKRRGIGGSLNLALGEVGARDLWLYNTDDWVLTGPMVLDHAVHLIDEVNYDYVRLLPLHPNLSGEVKFYTKIGWWLHLHNDSGYAFATRPFLANKKFYESIGPFDENLDAYETERLYAERTTRTAGIRLAALADFHGAWLHIGDYQVGKIDPKLAHV